eukprot:TRINITY_DN10416_c0_g1_i1.p1 TRINITY_DN10416_c0_g1~~TRINITY_DN10416_c0_g1_i1.p1  ORF type:complete len:206 (+),score=46.12 TRINITY_DN10416_c0_g1_i1:259-876(+)
MGLVGSFVKPTVGAIDFFARTTQGIRNTAAHQGTLDPATLSSNRVRPPRYFGMDKTLVVYEYEKSFWQNVIREIQHGRFRDEWYVTHIALEEDLQNETEENQKFKVLLLSNIHLFYLLYDSPPSQTIANNNNINNNNASNNNIPQLQFSVEIKNITGINKTASGVLIREKVQTENLDVDIVEKVIETTEKNRNFIAVSLEEAIRF